MSDASDIIRFNQDIASLQIQQLEDADLRNKVLELLAYSSEHSHDGHNFLPATIIRIADHFDIEDAPRAIAAVAILSENGALKLDGELDEYDLNSVESLLDVMRKHGLDDVDVALLAKVLGINMTLGVLDGFEAMGSMIDAMSQSDIVQIRRELGIDISNDEDDDSHDFEYLDDLEDEEQEVDVDIKAPDTESVEDSINEEIAIERLQVLLGRVGLTGVNIFAIASFLDMSLDEPDLVEEVSYALENMTEFDLLELRHKTDADLKVRRPQDIAAAIDEYRAAVKAIVEKDVFVEPAGTTETVMDDSGEIFEI